MDTWRRRLVLALAAVLIVVIGVPFAAVFPLFRDDRALDAVVVAVALDWRDFGEEAARQRLQFELDHHQINKAVRDESCSLTADDGGTRRVSCAWRVEVELPGVGWRTTLSFGSDAQIDPNGVLLR